MAYQTALEAISKPNEFVICGKHSGSGRFAKSESWGYKVMLYFELAGIKYERINDAPRGGRAGEKIRAIINS